MTKISPEMTIREIALLPEFSEFGEHIMLCRQETWARIQKTKVSAMIEKSGSLYQLGRFIRGFQNVVDLADAGHKIAFDFWDEPSCIMEPSRRQTKLFFFPGKLGAPFALVLSGGGYQSVCNNLEGFPRCPRADRCRAERVRPLVPCTQEASHALPSRRCRPGAQLYLMPQESFQCGS